VNLILHIGLGSFHRAHQAVYLNHLINAGDLNWSIAAGNIRPDMADTLEALLRQNGQYTVETISPEGTHSYERVHAIQKIVPYDAQLTGLTEVGADPSTAIISFTVTEAGYYLDPKNRLDLRAPDLQSDLDGRSRQTIYGAIAAILRERMRRGGPAVTLLNCDNLRSNGERFRLGLMDFLARRHEDALGDWVIANTTCPNAMVDRITPRPGPDVGPRVRAAVHWDDQAPVMAEDFIQWVIEDDFCTPRPDWERVGVQLVDSVLPFEEAKIRILNASHSCIAWAATLLGLHYIHEGVRIDAIRRMAYEYVTEDAIACLSLSGRPSPIDLNAYRDVVLHRFSNPYLRDTNQRVAMDGFSKIPGFIVPTLQERLAAGASIAKTAVLPALFFVFLERWHDNRLPFQYEDQGMDPAAAHAFFASNDPLEAFCANPVLWGPLAGDERLIGALRAALLDVRDFEARGS
jgi:D-arabinitol 4-dehydrogenase